MKYRLIFEDTFPSHLFIEMLYGDYGRHGILKESTYDKSSIRLLCEEHGIFPKCHDLSIDMLNTLYNDVKDKKKSHVFNFNDNLFINRIEVSIDYNENNQSFAYIPSKSKFGKDGKYNPLVLDVSAAMIKNGRGLASMMHELTHAYEDYCRKKNNVKSMSDISDNVGYDIYSQFLDDAKNVIPFILYYLTDFERNANVAKFAGELKSSNITFMSFGEALDYLKSTEIYHNYQVVFSWCNHLINVDDINLQKNILTAFNRYSKYNFFGYKELRKWLYSKVRRYKRKFDVVIPKLICKYCNIGEKMFPQSNVRLSEMIDIDNFLRLYC